MNVRFVCLLLAVCFVFVLTPPPIYADDWLDQQSVAELNNLTKTYFSQNKPDSALIIAKRAVKKAKAEFGETSSEVATCLHSQATLLYSSGRPVAARPLFRQALILWDAKPPADTVLWGACKYNMGLIYLDNGQYSDADRLFRQALYLLKPRLPENDPNLAGVYFDIGEVCRAMQANDSAIVYYNEALRRQQAASGKYDLKVARTWNNLGLVLAAQARYTEAEDAYNKALTSLERVLGADDLEVGYCIENLVSMYVKTSKNEAAGRLASLARGIFEKRLGPNSLEVAEITYIQGIISQRSRDYKTAEASYREVRSRLQNKTDSKSLQLTDQVLTSLEELYAATGELQKAEAVRADRDRLKQTPAKP